MKKYQLAAFAVMVLTLAFASEAQAGSTYAVGDVFLGVEGVGVEVFTPSGTLVQTITGGTIFAGKAVTGMAFQNNGNLLVTDFNGNAVVQFDNAGNLLNGTFATFAAGSDPESIAISSSGNVYVGQADAHPSPGMGSIGAFSSTGASLGSITVQTQNRGTDWIDLAANQTTILYTSEGSAIKSATVTGTQNADFSNVGSTQYALRMVPGGTFSGDVLVANSSDALLIGTNGSILKSYTLPGNAGGDFALNIDPNGKDFWTADLFNGMVWEINIATGAVDEQWSCKLASGGGCGTVAGLAVFGQQTASGGGGGGGGGTSVPEPSTLMLLVGGLVSVGGFAKRRGLI